MNANLLSISNAKTKPANSFLKYFILTSLLIFGFTVTRAQVSTYAVTQSTGTLAALPAGRVNLFPTSGLDNDNGVQTVALPFAFQFNGICYNSINISMNGFATFGTAPAPTEISPISSAVNYGGVISAYGWDWDQITPSAINNVSYFTANSAPNRIFKIQWNVRRSNNLGTAASPDTNNMAFQIWLNEGTNVIQIYYNTYNPSNVLLTQGQIGLRGATNSDFKNFDYSAVANWPGNAAPAPIGTMPFGATNTATVALTNNNAQIITTTAPNGSNKVFTFTPALSCYPPTALAITGGSVTSSAAQATWTAPCSVPSGGYQYEIRTSGAAGSGATGLAQSGTIAGSPLNMTGLAGGTTYTVYIRSDCGGTYSAWTTGVSFTTLCTAANIPYTGMYFDPFDTDGFTVPALPACTSQQNVGTGNLWVTDATNEEGWFDEHLMYNADGSNAANVWFFTKGINLVAGNTYRLSYEYGGSTNFSFITNKMLVAYGTSPAAASMTTQLANHPNIKVSPTSNVVNFTPTSSGVFYFGFKAYSAANQGRLFLDNIEIVNSICKKPSALAVSSVSYNSATASWTANPPAPGSGYAYYLTSASAAATAMVAGNTYVIRTLGTTDFTLVGAASNTVGTVFIATGAGTGTGTVFTSPDGSSTPTGYTSAGTTVVTLTGLTANTTYAIWVRGNCGSPDDSEWSIPQIFTTLTTPPYCIPGASASTATGILNVTTTNAITNINNSSVYVAPGYSDYSSLIVTESQSGSFNFSVGFNTAGGVGIAIFIDWNNDGDFVDAGETAYSSGAYLTTSPATGTINVPAGAALATTRMRVVADYWAINPSPCSLSATGPRGEVEDYSFKVVTPPPPLTISLASSTQCAGTNSPTVNITSALANFDTYSWSPAGGVSGTPGTGFTFNSGTTITYTLTGTQTSGTFSTNTATFTYIANALPTPITLTAAPASAATCQSGPAVQITASGGVVSGVPILSEDFNSGVATGWTFTNTSTGSTPTSSNWTIHPDGFDPTGPSWGVEIMHSNDATNFIFSDSDSNGIGSTTNVTMTSPVFSLAGYTAASLRFWHYYRSWTPSTAKVQISTNGTAGPWTDLNTYTNVTQGTPTSWVQVVNDLGAYLGQSNLAIRFNWNANWGWGWGIDNFLVSGSATSAITWTPAAGLYTDAGATTPYVAGTGAQTVYALPSATTLYTATASTPAPVCTTNTTQNISITPIVAGTLSSASQSTCDGIITDITLSGSSGTIVWQSATNSTFTAGLTDIPGSNGLTTLTSAILGAVTSDLYIRVKITNGSCTTYSATHTITVPVSTWNGAAWVPSAPTISRKAVFAGNFSSTGNLTACSVQVISGNVVINSGHTLTVQNSVAVSGGTLTFNNNLTGSSGSLVQINDAAVNTGYITYKRDAQPMIQFDYTYWSSPVSPQTLTGLSPLTQYDKYFQFNAAAGVYQSVPGNSLMDAGRGYIIRAPESYTASPTIFTGIFNGGSNDGIPNNGVINETVVGGTKYNLLGNPYPSAIDADLFRLGNPGMIDGNFYFWTHNTAINPTQYTQSDYAQWNSTGGVGTAGGGVGNSNIPDGNIAAGQGFFVVGTGGGTAVFNNSMRLTNLNGNFYRLANASQTRSAVEKHRIWLEMKNDLGAYKQTLVGYVQGATNDKDIAYDGGVADGGNVIGLYSVLGADKLGIQGRALPFDSGDLVPLGYKSSIAGTFQIALSLTDGLFSNPDQGIFLEDKLLNVIHNLRSGGYTFTTATGTFDQRFVLRYTDGVALGINDPVFTEQSVVVYKNETGLHINTSGITMDNVRIFDVRGRLIAAKSNVNSSETVFTDLNVADEVLIVRIQSDDSRTVNKKVVY